MSDTKTTQHTELPWITQGRGICSSRGYIGKCESSLNGQSIETQEANAAFIVRAVNSHYELVEACKNLLDEVRDHRLKDDPHAPSQMEWESITEIEDLLAKAEGRK